MSTTARSQRLNLLLTLLVLFSLLLSGCGGADEPPAAPGATEAPAGEPAATEAPAGEPAATEAPASQPGAAEAPAAPGGSGTWLVISYQNADDVTLEGDIFLDLNEMELVGSTDRVTLVSQLDRLAGAGYAGDGDITTAKRYLVTQDSDMEHIASQEIADLGEVNSADPQTLVDFAVWAIQTYPADRYALIMSDHGGGWMGGWNDDDPVPDGAMPMMAIDSALAEIIAQTGIGQFDLVGFDACLMGQLEVMSSIAPHARYAVGSEEVEPAMGWAYASIVDALVQNPDMDGAELAKTIVDTYIAQDYRLADEQAFQAFRSERGLPPEVSSQDFINYQLSEVTLTALDLSRMVPLNQAVNDLALALNAADPALAGEARAYAQNYNNVFGKEFDPSFIDLGHFATLVSQGGDEQVKTAAQAVLDAIQQALVAEKHGDQRPGSTGLTVYFPDAKLFDPTFISSNLLYYQYIARFAAASLWDDFLTAYYTGGQIDPNSADLAALEPAFQAEQMNTLSANSKPTDGAAVNSPAAGSITVEPLSLSAEEIPLDGSVNIQTTVTGQNVAYMFIYTYYHDVENNRLIAVDANFISSENSKEVGGVLIPDWGESGEIPISVDWTPTPYVVSDGNDDNNQFAVFSPDTYGATYEEDIYSVSGVYTSLDGASYEAVLTFSNGQMRDLWVQSQPNTGLVQVFPQPGETFTIWLETINEQSQQIFEQGGTVTFGETPLTFKPGSVTPGTYLVQIVATDFDGNMYIQQAPINVTP